MVFILCRFNKAKRGKVKNVDHGWDWNRRPLGPGKIKRMTL